MSISELFAMKKKHRKVIQISAGSISFLLGIYCLLFIFTAAELQRWETIALGILAMVGLGLGLGLLLTFEDA